MNINIQIQNSARDTNESSWKMNHNASSGSNLGPVWFGDEFQEWYESRINSWTQMGSGSNIGPL